MSGGKWMMWAGFSGAVGLLVLLAGCDQQRNFMQPTGQGAAAPLPKPVGELITISDLDAIRHRLHKEFNVKGDIIPSGTTKTLVLKHVPRDEAWARATAYQLQEDIKRLVAKKGGHPHDFTGGGPQLQFTYHHHKIRGFVRVEYRRHADRHHDLELIVTENIER